jgi:hypothetical protein
MSANSETARATTLAGMKTLNSWRICRYGTIVMLTGVQTFIIVVSMFDTRLVSPAILAPSPMAHTLCVPAYLCRISRAGYEGQTRFYAFALPSHIK